MFCPKCGKADQKENSYCRSCGEFLPDFNKKNKLEFGGRTPLEQIKVSQFLNLYSAVAGFAMAILLYLTHWGKPDVSFSVYLAAAFLLCIGFWQTSNFVVGIRLKRHLERKENVNEEIIEPGGKSFHSAQTQELLPEADFSNIATASITENTTKNLTVRNNISSSQTEQ